jgi:hypothetical protein
MTCHNSPHAKRRGGANGQILPDRRIHAEVGSTTDVDRTTKTRTGAQRREISNAVVVRQGDTGHGDDMPTDTDVRGENGASEQDAAGSDAAGGGNSDGRVQDGRVPVLGHPERRQPFLDKRSHLPSSGTDDQISPRVLEHRG